MKKALLFIFALALASFTDLHATHVAGGDIQYRYIGDSTGIPRHYEVLVRLYRDASPGTAGMPTSIPITVCSSCYANQTITAPLIAGGPGQIAPTLFDCVTPGSQGTVPIEYYFYRGYVTLPGNCANFTFAYTLCCRNNAIQNLQAPGGIVFYINARLNNMFGQNSSPRFVSEPVRAFCVNRTFNWSQNVVELNGDSLIFKLAHSKSAGTGCAFNLATYLAGFTALQPITTTPANSLVINPNTGTITFTPAVSQIVVVAVEVEEYRFDSVSSYSWVLVGSSYRDMQIGIAPACSPLAMQGVILDYNAPGVYPDSINGLPTVDYTCLDSTITIPFSVKLDCNSISPDGTDFRLTAPDGQPIPVKALVANCDANNETQEITVKLHKPLAFNGYYYLYSKIGNDGNTLLNKCGFPMEEFDTIQLRVEGCFETDMDIKNVTIVDDEHPKVEWYLDTVGTALNPFPTYLVNQYKILRRDPGQPNFVQIFAINDYKTMYFNDKSLGAVDVDAESYEYKVEVVVNGSTAVSSRSIFSILLEAKQNPIMGDTIDLVWNNYLGWNNPAYTVYLGKNENGVWNDTVHVPLAGDPQVNPTTDTNYRMINVGLDKGDYRVCVLATNPLFLVYEAWSNCIPFTIFEPLPPPPPPIVGPDSLRIPNVFTPNNDGQNDVFYIENAETWNGPRSVQIFNRWGNVVYKTEKYDNMNAWDGTDPSGKKVADGVYFYVLDFSDTPTGERFQQNGNITIFGN